MEELTVKFVAKIDDQVAYNMYLYDHTNQMSAEIKRRGARIALASSIGALIVVSICWWGYVQRPSTAMVWLGAFGVLWMAIFWIVSLKTMRGAFQAAVRRLLSSDPHVNAESPAELTLSKTEIRSSSGRGTVTAPWESITQWADCDEAIYLVGGLANGFLIPSRALKTPQERANFIEFIRAHVTVP